ncbi:MAG: hypothetical protein LC640_09190 [Frankia sp.]|nr:hypothetical protein [Frankia sp.]
MNFNFQPEKMGTQSPGIVTITGLVTTGVAGVVSSSNIPGGGASIAKTAAKTGRYTITLALPTTPNPGVALSNLTFLGGFAGVLGPDDTAMTAAKGLFGIFRDDDISTTGAKDGTIELQFVRYNGTTDVADTELQDNASFYFTIFVGCPSVT